jgi:hypothetical protein
VNSKIVRIVIWGAVAIAVLAVVYVRNSRLQASRCADEANALVDEGETKRKELESESGQLLRGTVPKELTSDRAKLEESVAKFNERYTTLVGIYRAAAAKFEEGGKAAKNESLSQYWELMSQAYRNFADGEEAHRKAILLLVDKSIPSEDELRQKRETLLEEARKANSEFERLDFEAQKLRNENKSQFK